MPPAPAPPPTSLSQPPTSACAALFTHLAEEVFDGATNPCDRGGISAAAAAATLPMGYEPFSIYFEYQMTEEQLAYKETAVAYSWGGTIGGGNMLMFGTQQRSGLATIARAKFGDTGVGSFQSFRGPYAPTVFDGEWHSMLVQYPRTG